MRLLYTLYSCGIYQATGQQNRDILCYYVGQNPNSKHVYAYFFAQE